VKTIGEYRFSSFLQKARRLKKEVEKNTQELRVKLLTELERMFNIAKGAAEKAEDAKEKQRWVRVVGYLGQVMNSIAGTFDEAKALEYLENLERMIHESKRDSEKGKRAGKRVA